MGESMRTVFLPILATMAFFLLAGNYAGAFGYLELLTFFG
jgi:hypothetical protein